MEKEKKLKSRQSVQISAPKKEEPVEKESSTLIRWKESNQRAQYRKSSIPFVDRVCQVRFNRVETCITSLKEGPYQPILGGTSAEEALVANLKPILKKTQHPILVDVSLLKSIKSTATTPAPFLAEPQRIKTLTNDELIVCTGFLGQLVALFSKAERRVRGVFDILSFPSSTSDRVELLGRFKATLMIGSDLIHRICTVTKKSSKLNGTGDAKTKNAKSKPASSKSKGRRECTNPYVINSSEMIHATGLTQNLLTRITNTTAVSKKFLRANKKLHHQWDVVLKRRAAEFSIPFERTRRPVYPQEAMPENVTLYENIAETSYPVEGSVAIMWSPGDMKINTDMDSTPVQIESCSIEEEFEMLDIILSNSHDLLKYAMGQLEVALESLSDASLQSCYTNVKLRLVDLDYETHTFDPLVSLELKNTLCEMATRKSELLNLAEKLEELMSWCLQFIRTLHTYSMQLLHGDRKEDKKYRGLLCGACAGEKFVSYKELMDIMGPFQSCDLWITIPMPIRIQMIVQKQQNAVKMKRGASMESSR